MVWPACNLQPSFDVIGFLQIVHSNFAFFGDGRQRFSARNSVHICLRRGNAMEMLRERQRLLGRVQLLRSLHLAEHARVVAPV